MADLSDVVVMMATVSVNAVQPQERGEWLGSRDIVVRRNLGETALLRNSGK